jgi:hypothetical protein
MDNNSLDSILSDKVVETPAQPEAPQPETVVETPKEPDQVETATGDETAPPAEQQKDDPLEKHRKGLEAAATAERKKRQDAEARAMQLERELHALRNPPPAPPQQPQEDDPKPLRSQYETEDEWLDARDEWRDRGLARQAKAEQERQRANTVKTKAETVMAEAMTMPGFNLMEFATKVPVTEPMMDAILESDAAAKLVHFLHANPEEAVRIAQMPSTAKQIAALTRIEDKLSAAPPPPPKEEKQAPQLPQTLTQARNAQGRFEPAYSGPTPLDAILKT